MGPKMGGGEGEELRSQLIGAQSVGGEDEVEDEEKDGSRLMDLAFRDEGRLKSGVGELQPSDGGYPASGEGTKSGTLSSAM